ncbi:MAG TPA: hypothetical protein VG013_15235 [Gemmataceae bacterium]|jgi:hypothetical protein|nr:hypothetical protein [Gemmataceae bacterium]
MPRKDKKRLARLAKMLKFLNFLEVAETDGFAPHREYLCLSRDLLRRWWTWA